MRILIAEDDPYSLLILRLMLEKEPGWETVTVEHGAGAWDQLVSGPAFDLCILDIMMPDMTGLQLAARMRADPRFEEQPIIFCTALNDRATVRQASGLAASHYITKPYTRDHIIRQVRRAVANRAECSRIEAADRVAARLGLQPAEVLDLLGRLQTELGTLLVELETSPSALRSNLGLIRVNALKGAAANLGARRLAEELGLLESKRPAGDSQPPYDWRQVLRRVEAENEHLRRCLAAAPAGAPQPAGV